MSYLGGKQEQIDRFINEGDLHMLALSEFDGRFVIGPPKNKCKNEDLFATKKIFDNLHF